MSRKAGLGEYCVPVFLGLIAEIGETVDEWYTSEEYDVGLEEEEVSSLGEESLDRLAMALGEYSLTSPPHILSDHILTNAWT